MTLFLYGIKSIKNMIFVINYYLIYQHLLYRMGIMGICILPMGHVELNLINY